MLLEKKHMYNLHIQHAKHRDIMHAVHIFFRGASKQERKLLPIRYFQHLVCAAASEFENILEKKSIYQFSYSDVIHQFLRKIMLQDTFISTHTRHVSTNI